MLAKPSSNTNRYISTHPTLPGSPPTNNPSNHPNIGTLPSYKARDIHKTRQNPNALPMPHVSIVQKRCLCAVSGNPP